MASRYYQPGPDRALRVQSLFGAIATRYDLINDLQSFGLHRSWKRGLLRRAGASAGDCVLDLCCGTGDVALAVARSGARVVAVDFSPPMLQVAAVRAGREPADRAGISRVLFVAGDALRLPLVDGAVDLVTISYGLRNLRDLEAGLQEIGRVLRPGGRLAVLDFGKPAHPVWRGFYFAYLRFGVPLFGRLFCGDRDAYGYILESLQGYPGPEGVGRLLSRQGWTGVQGIPLLGGVMGINLATRPGAA